MVVKDVEAAVFIYFLSIGSGLSFGVALVALPAYLLYKKIQSRGVKHERNEKRSHRV